MRYNKLVRDKIPETIKHNGDNPVVHTADADEYMVKLREKLWEEVDEFLREPSEEELADIMEVIDAMVAVYGLSEEKALALKKEKAAKRGKSDKRIILEKA